MAQADGSLIFDTKIITDGFNKGMGAIKTAAKGIGVITAGFAAATGAALKFAGELEQNLGGSEAVFKEYAETIQKTADTAFKNMGLSSSDFLATANKMGALFQGSGFAIQESAELSAKTMQRAADVASIMGIDISMAMESIAGAAKGNFTMMDNLGVAMNDTTLAAYALEKGIQKSTRQMTNQEKIGLAMQMFLEKTEYAAGNYAKENETLAGSLGTAKAAMENFLAGSGKAEDLAESFSNAGKVIIKNIGELTPALASGLSDVFAELAPMMPDMIEELVDGLLGGADMLADSFGDMFASVVTIAADSAPEIIKASAVLINSFIDGLVDNSGELTAAALEIGEALVSEIISIAPRVVDAAGKILGAFATEIGNAMPLLTPFTAAVKFLADNVELCAAAFVIWKTSAAITGIITTVTS
ncbi:MAG: phage tail protein, partial [Clostridia bacterium]|nr:phage tail protein [Clostridia bacterium]